MDFIERWLGLSPDGGNGALEALYLVALVVVIAAIILGRHAHRRPTITARRRDR
ncbi:MAG TPA: hypothetical protein VKC17_09375 [Sphingomicrobium sp.]|nr:hypothetical protein [Sphingomicrobium sp.]